MKIIVCIKQVPDTTEVRIDPVTGTMIRAGVPSIMNPDDKGGLEAALRLKEEHGGLVTVITMGPPQAAEVLREALAMGADQAILLTDRAFAGADTWATSCTLAAALRKLEYDLVITGRQAIDGDTAQVGPQIAEHLEMPHVSYVKEVKRTATGLEVKRALEDGYQRLALKTPCLLTILAEIHPARYMSVAGVIDAHAPDRIIQWSLADLEVDRSNIGLKGSPTKVKKTFTASSKSAGQLLDGLAPAQAADVIVKKLQEKFIIQG